VAAALTAAALAVKLLLVPLVTQDAPFLLFFASVLASAWYGGLGPGLLATGLAAAASNYFFMVPFHGWGLTSDQLFRLALFVVEGAFITLISARLAAARQRAEQGEAEARLLERRILEIADEEQRRIGHDLHDGLGQHLTGIALMVRRLEHHLTAASSPDAEDARKLSELARTAVEWTHDLTRSLSPAVLETAGGLPEALRELASNAQSIFKIECTFEQDGAALPPVDLASRVHLYRIAQEAISNAVRHGAAKRVEIDLRGTSDALVLRIADDGAGIGHRPGVGEGARDGEGMGLRIMRYRARMIGATVNVARRSGGGGGGTEVLCVFEHARDDNC
jgi:signal transduction histidine kinase